MGKDNPEGNCSVPHGADRLFSRSAARHNFTVEIVKVIRPVCNFKAGK